MFKIYALNILTIFKKLISIICFQVKATLISLIAVEVGKNMERGKNCKLINMKVEINMEVDFAFVREMRLGIIS